MRLPAKEPTAQHKQETQRKVRQTTLNERAGATGQPDALVSLLGVGTGAGTVGGGLRGGGAWLSLWSARLEDRVGSQNHDSGNVNRPVEARKHLHGIRVRHQLCTK